MHGVIAATEFLAAAPVPMEIPNPGGGTAPPGIGQKFTTVLGWGKWIALGVCVLGLIIAGARMSISSNSGRGGEHGERLGWVLAGVITIAGAFSIVGFLAT